MQVVWDVSVQDGREARICFEARHVCVLFMMQRQWNYVSLHRLSQQPLQMSISGRSQQMRPRASLRSHVCWGYNEFQCGRICPFITVFQNHSKSCSIPDHIEAQNVVFDCYGCVWFRTWGCLNRVYDKCSDDCVSRRSAVGIMW